MVSVELRHVKKRVSPVSQSSCFHPNGRLAAVTGCHSNPASDSEQRDHSAKREWKLRAPLKKSGGKLLSLQWCLDIDLYWLTD